MTTQPDSPPETIEHNGRTLYLNAGPNHGIVVDGATWDTYTEDESTDPNSDRIYERRRSDGRILRTQ